MSGWICVMYQCEECNARFDTIETRDEIPETKSCHAVVAMDGDSETTCDGMAVRVPAIGYLQVIRRGNHDFDARQKERLLQRSNEHWHRQGRDEAVDRSRERMRKESKVT